MASLFQLVRAALKNRPEYFDLRAIKTRDGLYYLAYRINPAFTQEPQTWVNLHIHEMRDIYFPENRIQTILDAYPISPDIFLVENVVPHSKHFPDSDFPF